MLQVGKYVGVYGKIGAASYGKGELGDAGWRKEWARLWEA